MPPGFLSVLIILVKCATIFFFLRLYPDHLTEFRPDKSSTTKPKLIEPAIMLLVSQHAIISLLQGGKVKSLDRRLKFVIELPRCN
jgi:hypothetical protein